MTKFEERLATVESLLVSTDTRITELASTQQAMNQELQETKTALTEIRDQEMSEIRQHLISLQAKMKDQEKQLQDFITREARQELLTDTVYFAEGQAYLTTEAQTVLDKLGANLIGQNFSQLEIVGYADQEGASVSPLVLSQKRAEAVADYLSDRFHLDRQKFSIKSFEDAYPLTASLTEEGKAQSRRVEIKAFTLPQPQERVEVKQ